MDSERHGYRGGRRGSSSGRGRIRNFSNPALAWRFPNENSYRSYHNNWPARFSRPLHWSGNCPMPSNDGRAPLIRNSNVPRESPIYDGRSASNVYYPSQVRTEEHYAPIFSEAPNTFTSTASFASGDVQANISSNGIDERIPNIKNGPPNEGRRGGSHAYRQEMRRNVSNPIQEQSRVLGASHFVNDNYLSNHNTESEGTQRERLTEELSRGSSDCIICFESIRQYQRIWSCCNCYQVFHLNCVQKWAHSSESSDESWRCPGCQNAMFTKPKRYFCFCGKRENPEWDRHNMWNIPHSCGEQCLKTMRQKDCSHPCTLLCHPGPCPPCFVYVHRPCHCGKTSRQMKCNESETFSCDAICNRVLSCGNHKCRQKCHPKDQHTCDEKYVIDCYCGKKQTVALCDSEFTEMAKYCCGNVCARLLQCGNHTCDLLCHDGDCPPCQLSPELLKFCPCGKTKLETVEGASPRTLCTDPIFECDSNCGKTLSCGPKDGAHICGVKCHVGPCPTCPLTTMTKCNCGRNLEVKCEELSSEDGVRCKKRCNKMKTCGRHRCNQNCCTDVHHRCEIICARKLSCNLHKCDKACHLGNCPPCHNTSFSELTCHCGSSVMYPPIPCGTPPPSCDKPCQRLRNCEHHLQHNCHIEENCPPCTVLTAKWCYGDHELRSCIPCYQNDVCCGLPCGKRLSCVRHNCTRICHPGICNPDNLPCVQPCPVARSDCGHPCGLVCHASICPTSTCKAMVTVTCRCGRQTGSMFCAENLSVYNRMTQLKLSSNALYDEKIQRTRTLECDAKCALVERNRRFALALQIKNPDITNKLRPPAYSDFLKEQARKCPGIVSEIYQQLTDLVHSAKESKQKSRSHAFQVMKSDHRRIVHELAEFFGCETRSYDKEPKKNVVATAFKEKSWLPSVSLISVSEKEMAGNGRSAGKAPPPIPHCSSRKDVQPSNDLSCQENRQKRQAPVVDYFDYTQ